MISGSLSTVPPHAVAAATAPATLGTRRLRPWKPPPALKPLPAASRSSSFGPLLPPTSVLPAADSDEARPRPSV